MNLTPKRGNRAARMTAKFSVVGVRHRSKACVLLLRVGFCKNFLPKVTEEEAAGPVCLLLESARGCQRNLPVFIIGSVDAG